MADGELADDDLRPVTTVDALVHGGDLTLDLCAELARLAPFGLGNPGVTLLLAGCELADLGDGRRGQAPQASACARTAATAGSAIAFGFGPQLDRLRRVGPLRRRVPARGEPLERHRRPAARTCAQVFDADERYLERREWLEAEWRKAPETREPRGAAIFAELGARARAGTKRHLLESARFRALLDEPALARAA